MSITPFKQSGELVLLYKLTNANMQSTSDQVFTKMAAFNEALPMNYIAIPKNGGATVACTGGIYFQPSKAGTPDVAATATWINLDSTTNPKKCVSIMANMNSGVGTAKLIATGNIYLSLTTGSTGACTADILVYGYIVS